MHFTDECFDSKLSQISPFPKSMAIQSMAHSLSFDLSLLFPGGNKVSPFALLSNDLGPIKCWPKLKRRPGKRRSGPLETPGGQHSANKNVGPKKSPNVVTIVFFFSPLGLIEVWHGRFYLMVKSREWLSYICFGLLSRNNIIRGHDYRKYWIALLCKVLNKE